VSDMASPFIIMEIRMINHRLFILACFSIFILIVVPPVPKNIEEEFNSYLHYFYNHQREIRELGNYSIEASKESGICPEILFSIIFIESHKRPVILRKIEVSVLNLFIKARKVGIIRWFPDISIGMPQMKLSTALWINSGFAEPPIPYTKYTTSQISTIIKELTDKRNSIIFVTNYLNYILTKEKESGLFPKKTTASITLSNEQIARLASKYQGGVPFSSRTITKYGRLVELLSNSRFVKEVLENQ